MTKDSRQQGVTVISGAEFMGGRDGGLLAVQFRPEIMKQKDNALSDPEGVIKRVYRW
jgi:hypothetical protein